MVSVFLALLVGLIGAATLARAAREDAREREEVLAQQTGNVTELSVQQLFAAISGVSGIANPSGTVDQQSFETFAAAAVAQSPFRSLAYAPVVPAADRAAFEAAVGPIVDEPEGQPAAPRDAYVPVRWLVTAPDVVVDPSLVGFDLLVDDVRRAAIERARDTGEAVVSQAVPARPSGDPAIFVVHAVYETGTPPDATVTQRRDAVIGYATTGVLGEHLTEVILDQLDEDIGLRVEDVDPDRVETDQVEDAGPLLASSTSPADGVTVERVIGGRTWRITVDDQRGTQTVGALWLAIATLILAGTLGVLAWRADRHQHQVARHVTLVDRLAGIGRSLAGVSSVEAIRRVVRTEVPTALAADQATLSMTALATAVADGDGDGDAGAVHHESAGTAGIADAPGAGGRRMVRRRIPDPTGGTAATLEVVWRDADAVDDLTLAGLSTVGEMCGQALGRARVVEGAQRDAVTSRLLAGLAESAATAATADEVARRLVTGAGDVPGAATTHIGLLSDDGRSFSVVHQGLSADEVHVEVRDIDHPWPMLDAFRGNHAVLLGDPAAVRARFPEAADGIAAAGLAALASLPLVDSDGTPFGAVTLAWTTPQRFDAGLTTTLQATADLCASSLERARTTDRTQAGTSTLATLATHLSSASSFEDAGAAIMSHAPSALAADFALVGVVQGDRLRLLAPSGPQAAPLERYRETDLHGDFPVLRAIRQRQLVTFPSLDEIDAADRQVGRDLDAIDVRAAACAPLIGTDGEPSGVLVALWKAPPRFDEALDGRMRTIADLCAQSIERSRLFDAEHRVRRDIERAVVPEPPTMAGLEVATRYLPAAAEVGLGGDWYDAIALDDRRLALVVGDVSGHGTGAVATMTQVRTVVHTLMVGGGMALPEVLVRASALLQREGLGYATMLIAVVDLAAGAVDYVTAGHPPALVREPGGSVRALTGGRHSVLGIDLAAKPTGYVPFPVGATLVVYTDGLIERRDTELLTSVDELVGQVRLAGALDADAVADRLLASRPPAGADLDDVALVVVRRTG